MKLMQNPNELKPAPYYNYPQLVIKQAPQPHKMFIGGRGVGKTTIIADEVLKYMGNMPRGKVSLNGLTYFHIRTKSLPPIIDHWERRGIYRNIHYFVGRKAPSTFRWNEPYQPPLDYANCIHFFNGFVLEFNSFDRPEMARSGSYDGLIFDECTKLKKYAIDSDVMPANRGNIDRFGHLPYHHGTLFLGSMPLNSDGDWVFEYEKLMKKFPHRYLYLEASAYENRKILGEDYFRDLKRTMPRVIFDLEVANKRRSQNTSKFYPILSLDVHGYQGCYDYNFYDLINQDPSKEPLQDSRGDADCYKSEPLYLSFDFGSTQNCLIVAQWHMDCREMPIIKNFYVENETLKTLVRMFIKYYEHHPTKFIYLYGGSDGRRKNDAASRQTYFDDVIEMLAKEGWEVELKAELFEISHMDKFAFWHKFLSGEYMSVPRFRINNINAYQTFFSMENAPILPDEIRKDKRSERNTNEPRWKATDLSDAVDNLYYWMFYQSVGEQTYNNDVAFGN